MSDYYTTSTASNDGIENVLKLKSANLLKYSEAWQDIVAGVRGWRFWTYMAVSEIRRRYRRTLLGPFWTTMSVGLYIGCMGLLFSYLWKTDVKSFFPYFCTGYICWILFSAIVIDGCNAFVAAEGLAKQIMIPYSTFAWLVIYRNLIVFAHHFLAYLVIVVVFKVHINKSTLLFIPGILILCVAGFWFAIIMGLICARYRDLLQVVGTFLQICMFLTPIFWSADQLHGIRLTLLVDFNPLHHYLNIIRAPLLGHCPSALDWYVAIGNTIFTGVIAFLVFANYRRKLIYWL